MSTYKEFLKKKKKEKRFILFFQFIIIIFILSLWEILSKLNLINTFLSSSPSNILDTFIKLIKDNNFFPHLWVTLYEIIISFSITCFIGFIIASIMWYFPKFAKIIDPYLTILNSLPKVALGPLIIIWIGANTKSIIFMSLLISCFITIINVYSGFISVDKYYITLLKSFGASRLQIFYKLIVPGSKSSLINSIKINISMSLIGCIMGELLVSKKGLGYLIMYGSQVFNINLVITSVVILGILSYIMYEIVAIIEKNS